MAYSAEKETLLSSLTSLDTYLTSIINATPAPSSTDTTHAAVQALLTQVKQMYSLVLGTSDGVFNTSAWESVKAIAEQFVYQGTKTAKDADTILAARYKRTSVAVPGELSQCSLWHPFVCIEEVGGTMWKWLAVGAAVYGGYRLVQWWRSSGQATYKKYTKKRARRTRRALSS